MPLRHKFTAAFALITLATCFMGLFTLRTYDITRQSFNTFREEIVPHTLLMLDTKATMASLSAGVEIFQNTGKSNAWESAYSQVPALQEKLAILVEQTLIESTDEHQAVQDLQKRVNDLVGLYEQFVGLLEQGQERNTGMIGTLRQFILSQQNVLNNLLNTQVTEHLAELDTAQALVDESIVHGTQIIWFIIIGTAGSALIAGYYLTRSVLGPLNIIRQGTARIGSGDLDHRIYTGTKDELAELASGFNSMAANLQRMVETERATQTALETAVTEYMQFVEQVSGGNLTARLELDNHTAADSVVSDDLYQLGTNLNGMVDSLSRIAHFIREASAGVINATAEIQAATVQQTASIAEQDAAITQTIATVSQVRETVAETAKRAQTVAESSRQSVAVSRQGQDVVSNTIAGMQVIRQRVDDIAETILMLSERTQQIGEIINTVNALADQSKLLALNASIEAARAGEEGRGFAVVAMEVRQLAEQSRAATARVRDILSEIQQATNTAVMVTEEGSKGADTGVSLVERAGSAIRELAAILEEAAQSSTQIAASTHQQANGMDQLVAAMAQIQQASTQASASTTQTEQSVHNIVKMVEQLEAAIASYRL
jgi:methyl-accepting chemotaxis protein